MTYRFSVFGDVHGRVPLMLLLTRAWQEFHDEILDGVLQVGDMGAFPDHHKLDKSTARFAADDPDELDFVYFLTDTPLARGLLADDDTPSVVFCRGNHEDFDFLGQFGEPSTLDPYGKLWFLPDGQALTWGPLRIGAFGGAPPIDRPTGRGKPGIRSRMRPRFHPDAAGRAFAAAEPLDILLTHGGPEHSSFPAGCRHLAGLAARVRPRVHLFGHHHAVVGPHATQHGGRLVGLEHLEFLRDGTLRPGSWGVLTIDAEAVTFEWMDKAPWAAHLTRAGWRQALQ